MNKGFKLINFEKTAIGVEGAIGDSELVNNDKTVLKITPEWELLIPLTDKDGEERMIPIQEIYDSLDLIKETLTKGRLRGERL